MQKKKNAIILTSIIAASLITVVAFITLLPPETPSRDTTKPTLEIHSPINISYNSATQLLKISASDDNAIDTIWYNWNNVNVTYTSESYIIFNEGLNTIQAWVNDTAGNVQSISVSFTIDTILPSITIESPLNNIYNSRTLLVNITTADNVAVDSIWYFWNVTNGNETYTLPHSVKFDEGVNILQAWVNDTAGNKQTTSVSFTIDTTFPSISIESPLNTTYYDPLIQVNITTSDDISVDTIWYNWNGTITPYTVPHSILVTEGYHEFQA